MPILRGNIWIWLNALWFLIGIYILQWRAEAILFGYLIESVIIGCIAVFKMTIIGLIGKAQKEQTRIVFNRNFTDWEKNVLNALGGKSAIRIMHTVFLLTLFTGLYFVFIYGQSVFTFLLLSQEDLAISDSPGKLWDNVIYLFSQKDIQQSCYGIIASNLLILTQEFILPNKCHTITLQRVFVQPWVRIFVQQVLVTGSGVAFFVFDFRLASVATLLITLKVLADNYFYNKIYTPSAPPKPIANKPVV